MVGGQLSVARLVNGMRLFSCLTWGAAIACVAVPGCTFFVKNDASQCATDKDCTSRGPAFEGTFCSAGGICQSNASYCFSNQQCIDRAKGGPAICRKSTDHTCVSILSPECARIIGDTADLKNDDVVVLGTIMMPSWNPLLKAAEDTIELAMTDLKTTAGGLKATNGSGTPRPVVVAACDIALSEQEKNRPASDHLIGDLHVPVMFGPLPAVWINYAFQKSLATTPKTVIITPSAATGAELTKAPGRRGVFFRSGYTATSVAATVSQLVPNFIEPAVRQQRGISPSTPIRYAVVGTGRGPEGDIISSIYDRLVFNGKTAPENGANYKEFSYGDPSQADFDTKLADVLVGVQAFQPDIVFLIGNQEIPSVLIQIDKLGIPSPHFIGTADFLGTNDVPNYVGTDETIRRRIWILQPGRGSQSPEVARFFQRLGAAYPEDVPNELAALTLDTTYMSLYAMASAGDRPVTPEIVGDALLTKLNVGAPIAVGPADMLNALGTLEAGGTISFHGTEVNGNFDDNGDIPVNYQVFCVDSEATSSDLIGFKPTGITYDPVTDKLTGTNTCF